MTRLALKFALVVTAAWPAIALSSSCSPGQDAFTDLEFKNWQRAVDAYDKGFGPLTSQAVPTLLDRAGFQQGGGRLLDVACGPGQVLAAAIALAWAAPPATEGFDLILGAVNAAGNPNVPLPAGPPFFQYADPATVRQALAKAGFVDADVTTVDWMEWRVDSADELYEIFLEGTARTRELLRGQTETEAEAVREELRRRFGERRGALRMPVVVSSGQKPL